MTTFPNSPRILKGGIVLVYLNRLSDLLFVMARVLAREHGV